LLVGSLVAWQSHAHWMSPLRRRTANAMRFLAGSYGLAEAYSHAGAPPTGCLRGDEFGYGKRGLTATGAAASTICPVTPAHPDAQDLTRQDCG